MEKAVLNYKCWLLRSPLYLNLSPKFSRCTINNTFYVSKRSLYTLQALGLQDFQKQRAKFQQQFPQNEADRFREALQEQIARSHNTLMLVFKQDLEKAIYLCRENEEDISLVKDLLLKFNAQNRKVRFGSFRFGAVLMRLLYELDRPDVALELMETPELSKLLSEVSTLQVFMGLLYKHELHSEVLDIQDNISTGRLTNGRYPRICVIIALASALKQGTEESLARGLALTEACVNTGRWPSRFYAIAGTIALQAGRPDTALQLLHNTAYASHLAIRNILLQAWCELGRLDQVMSLLRPVTANMRPGTLVHQSAVFPHTLDTIKAAVEQQNDAALKQDLARIERALLSSNCDGYLVRRTRDREQALVECVLSPLDMSEVFPGRNKWADNSSRTPHLERESLLDESG
ncbi:hypothetical protein FHG87_017181 [Trinorchestia longiramus]|nr:hypothetical protein FHG87_017181 [Trinorchestia longiramus]